MHTDPFDVRRCARSALALAAVTALTLANGTPTLAAQLTWAGLADTPLWSDARNWVQLQAPLDGDELLFGGTPRFATSTLDVSRSFAALSFAADAGAFALQVQGDGATAMTFTGAGLRNLTGGSGPIRQTLQADAGTTGGTLRFSGSAGINLGTDTGFRPIDLVASGGGSSGHLGGRVVFEGQAATSSHTFDALRADGASTAGAGGGEIVFRDDAAATPLATITLRGGTAPGASGGSASAADRARLGGNLNVMAGLSGGLGGRATFSGSASVSGSLDTAGGVSATPGTEGRAAFHDDARLTGSAVNRAGGITGASGGLLAFSSRAALDASAVAPGTGALQVRNEGSSVAGAGGGATVFRDDALVRGADVFVDNRSAEDASSGSTGGTTSFLDRSRAGSATIRNAGTGAAGAVGGLTRFLDQSSAEQARITMNGGTGAGGAGGGVRFGDDSSAAAAQLQVDGGAAAGAFGGTANFIARSTAGSARVVNGGGETVGARGGTTVFESTANAGSARITNAIGTIDGASGGVTEFRDASGAGLAYILNDAGVAAGSGGRGSTLFRGSSSAQGAIIDNQGGVQRVNGFTSFSQFATAGNASITNAGGRATGAGGGFTQFLDRSTAGAATLVMAGGITSGAEGGDATFFADADAGNATLQVRGASAIGATGGTARFVDRSSAGRATFVVEGSRVDDIGGPEGGVVSFDFAASADHASFAIGGNHFAFGRPGQVTFADASTAAEARFMTLAGFDAGGRLTFTGNALHTASAGSASITNGSRAAGAISNGDDFGGTTIFRTYSSAGHAAITNEAGATAFGAQLAFLANSSAADAVIVNLGGRTGETGGITFFRDTSDAGRSLVDNRAGALNAAGLTLFDGTASAAQSTLTARGASANGEVGGQVIFDDRATAAQSTLVAEGGSAGGMGGRIAFQRQATGGTARLVLNGGDTAASGGTLDIGRVDTWLQVGSIEGGGTVVLGSKSLLIVGNGRATTFSGVIGGGTPAVFPSLSVLGGSLTLTGANLYTGRTQIGDGVNANSGTLVSANTTGSATGRGEVRIQRGGTLAGSGFIDGPVALHDGGTIAPGDSVTLTLRDSLTWDDGGVVRLVLGADDAGSGHVVVHSLLRGGSVPNGPFAFDLVDIGIVAGQTYQLILFDTMSGFGAGDFTFAASAVSGSFAIADHAITFTATAVPEPATAIQFVLGALCLAACMRRASRRRCR